MAHRVTLIPGDGIGPELAEATTRVLDATGIGFEWESVEAGEAAIAAHGTPLPDAVLESVRRTKIGLKGPITTPVGGGFRSVNVGLRQALGLYANLRPAKSMAGVESRYDDVDLIIVRENTEDLYAGIEHMVGRDAAESIKIITREASERIARFAFEYAVANGRRKVTAVHKANIMKLSDGLFLESCRTVAADYEGRIEFEDRIVDNMCMQLVQKPELYDVHGPAQPVRRHRERPVRRPGRWPGRRAGRQHRDRGGRLRAGPRLRAQVRRPRPRQPDRDDPVRGADAPPSRLPGGGRSPRGRRPRRHRGGPADDLRPRRDDRARRASPTRSSSASARRPRPPPPDDGHPGQPPAAPQAGGHRRPRPGQDPPARPLVGGARRPGDGVHGLRDVPVHQRHPADAVVRDAVRARGLPLAAVLAAHRAGLAADLVQPRDLHPVDPARVPRHLLLLPQGVLPLLLRGSARLRRRRAAHPPALPDGGGPAVHPPELPPLLPVPGVHPAVLPVGRRRVLAPGGGPVADRSRGVRARLQRLAPDRLLPVLPLAAPPDRRAAGLLLVHAPDAGALLACGSS